LASDPIEQPGDTIISVSTSLLNMGSILSKRMGQSKRNKIENSLHNIFNKNSKKSETHSTQTFLLDLALI
jgi:hypothetical protein